jgi:hypothetical protein
MSCENCKSLERKIERMRMQMACIYQEAWDSGYKRGIHVADKAMRKKQ